MLTTDKTNPSCYNIILIVHAFISCPSVPTFSDVLGLFERPVYWFGHPNCGVQKTLFKFYFFSCISTKNMLKQQSMISQCI